MADREEFLQHLAAELDAMERQFDALEADVRADRPPEAAGLREQLREAAAQAQSLKEASAGEWEHGRAALDAAWRDLKKAFSQMHSRLGD